MNKSFFDLEMYATYGAITELYGEKGWDVVWRAGELAWEEVKEQVNITKKEPMEVMKKVSEWLEKIGYAKKLNIVQTGKNELLYEMYAPIGRQSVTMLRKKYGDEKPVKPHYSTTLLFAALKDVCHVKAEIRSVEHVKPGTDPSREKWIFKQQDSK